MVASVIRNRKTKVDKVSESRKDQCTPAQTIFEDNVNTHETIGFLSHNFTLDFPRTLVPIRRSKKKSPN